MSNESTETKWNNIYSSREEDIVEPSPAEVLSEHACLLPQTGVALDLASGLGGNAIFLVQRGLSAHAWDISQQATLRLQHYCDINNIAISVETRDVKKQPPLANTFDLICCSYFLERSLSQQITAALRSNGLLFYQTFTVEKVTDDGPSNLNYRLQENELLTMFSSLHVLAYKEYGCVGDTKKGLRNIAQLVAQKR